MIIFTKTYLVKLDFKENCLCFISKKYVCFIKL